MTLYIVICVGIVIMLFMAYFMGKKDERLDVVEKRAVAISNASSIRTNADIDGLRKKYKRDTL